MKFIKNWEPLTENSTTLRKDMLEILDTTLQKVTVEKRINHTVKINEESIKFDKVEVPLSTINNIYVVGTGKATYMMACALYEPMGGSIKEGCIVVKNAPSKKIGPITVIEGGHPIPNKKGIDGTERIVSLVECIDEHDLLIVLISGGGSALMCLPLEGISLENIQKMNNLLLASDASIGEINVLRKHLSQVKGGKLSRIAYPSRVISLIVSDVVGDDLSTIASGPTTGDSSTFADAMNIIEKYHLREKMPSTIIETIEKGINGTLEETVKPRSKRLSTTKNICVLNNFYALSVAKNEAERRGYRSLILSSHIAGDARECGRFHSSIAQEILVSYMPVPSPAVVLSGGETTVSIDDFGNTEGGPNQECVCGFMSAMDTTKDVVFLSIDSDGIDGNSEFAGAITGGRKNVLKREEVENALREHRTSVLFSKIKGGIRTGETENNINDIRILGISPRMSHKIH